MIYSYAVLNVTNPDAMSSYRDVASSTLAKHGGKVDIATSDITVLDGSPDTPDVAALLNFQLKRLLWYGRTIPSLPRRTLCAVVLAGPTFCCWADERDLRLALLAGFVGACIHFAQPPPPPHLAMTSLVMRAASQQRAHCICKAVLRERGRKIQGRICPHLRTFTSR